MAWGTVRTWTTGELVTAAFMNTIRDQLLETAPAKVTTAGDLVYGSAANALARLGIGSTGQVLTVAAGLPSWGTLASTGKVASIRRTTAQTISSGVETLIALDGETLDPLGWHDGAVNTERITVDRTGVAVIVATVALQTNPTGNRKIRVKLNGTTIETAMFPGPDVTTDPVGQCVAIRPVVATDYVTMSIEQFSGSALATIANITALSVALL